MPNLCGNELASEILKIAPKLPIILCTGFGDAIGEEQAARIGIKKYLRKPLNSAQLVSAIQELLTG
ncbi:MAG: response regulator [Nitrospirae bacterium]|nr:MAG: response regulator [Nitrospirota bacterium]